ncbi:TetR/AcrR family transcriptional regulator [Nocardia brasiliensis]|uniref:TetR/AcrR family transcriptional regulator n=1 Tax=Nocardia brasiliensis TaxID=37326 RepID=UPI00366EEA74
MTVNDQDTADDRTDVFRRRLLQGLAASIEERGYRDTTVADIVRHAQTSRRTFYQHFDSKETCIAALLMETSREILAFVTAAVDSTAPWATQVQQAIEAWFHANEARAALALTWVSEVPSLGLAARTLQRDMAAGFIDLVVAICDTEKSRAAGAAPASRDLAALLLAGLRELTAAVAEQSLPMSEAIELGVDASIRLLGPPAERTNDSLE